MIHGFIHKQLGSMIYHSHLTYAIFHILLNSYKTWNPVFIFLVCQLDR